MVAVMCVQVKEEEGATIRENLVAERRAWFTDALGKGAFPESIQVCNPQGLECVYLCVCVCLCECEGTQATRSHLTRALGFSPRCFLLGLSLVLHD